MGWSLVELRIVIMSIVSIGVIAIDRGRERETELRVMKWETIWILEYSEDLRDIDFVSVTFSWGDWQIEEQWFASGWSIYQAMEEFVMKHNLSWSAKVFSCEGLSERSVGI